MNSVREPLIFLSYARKDVANIKLLFRQLKEAGYNPWMDVENLLPGQDWLSVVKETIAKADFFVACLSTHSVSHRGVVQMEIREALEMALRRLDGDIYFIPIRLDDCKVPTSMAKFHWIDFFIKDDFSKLLAAIREGIKQLGITPAIKLRSYPIQLNSEDAKQICVRHNFFERIKNPQGTGILHQYELLSKVGLAVLDHTTQLTWDLSYSKKTTFRDSVRYLDWLNTNTIAGYSNWRLPTLEEGMSLIESRTNMYGQFIGQIFEKTPFDGPFWTSDRFLPDPALIWALYFTEGGCSYTEDRPGYARAVC